MRVFSYAEQMAAWELYMRKADERTRACRTAESAFAAWYTIAEARNDLIAMVEQERGATAPVAEVSD